MLINLRKRRAERKRPLMMVCFSLFSFRFFSFVRVFFFVCFDPLLSFFLAEDDDLMMPEIPAGKAVTDPIVASEEAPRDSVVVPESSYGMIFFAFSPFCFFSLPPLADIFCFLVSYPARGF